MFRKLLAAVLAGTLTLGSQGMSIFAVQPGIQTDGSESRSLKDSFVSSFVTEGKEFYDIEGKERKEAALPETAELMRKTLLSHPCEGGPSLLDSWAETAAGIIGSVPAAWTDKVNQKNFGKFNTRQNFTARFTRDPADKITEILPAF